MSNKIGIGIIGHTGMVGSEIAKILAHHDNVQIDYRKNSKIEEGTLTGVELIFLATKDEESMTEARRLTDLGKRVIDTSGAFRFADTAKYSEWYKIEHKAPDLAKLAVYGMPASTESHRTSIKNAQLVANPGCYSTTAILALRPLEDIIHGPVRINATSGISGARKEVSQIPSEETYGHGRKHKHVPEIEQYGLIKIKSFVPVVMHSVFRGINANIEFDVGFDVNADPKNIVKRISEAYQPDDLVFTVEDTPEKKWGTADVNNTHFAMIKVRSEGKTVYLTSMIDNLGKGAASQAVENMNIMLGLPRLHGIAPTYRTTR